MSGRKKSKIVPTRTETQSKLICTLAQWNIRGLVRIPFEEIECQRVLGSYSNFIEKREKRIWNLIEDRTKDENLQQKIYNVLMARLNSRKM